MTDEHATKIGISLHEIGATLQQIATTLDVLVAKMNTVPVKPAGTSKPASGTPATRGKTQDYQVEIIDRGKTCGAQQQLIRAYGKVVGDEKPLSIVFSRTPAREEELITAAQNHVPVAVHGEISHGEYNGKPQRTLWERVPKNAVPANPVPVETSVFAANTPAADDPLTDPLPMSEAAEPKILGNEPDGDVPF